MIYEDYKFTTDEKELLGIDIKHYKDRLYLKLSHFAQYIMEFSIDLLLLSTAYFFTGYVAKMFIIILFIILIKIGYDLYLFYLLCKDIYNIQTTIKKVNSRIKNLI
jgi:hypothetical protein